jgi:hypothetical protein
MHTEILDMKNWSDLLTHQDREDLKFSAPRYVYTDYFNLNKIKSVELNSYRKSRLLTVQILDWSKEDTITTYIDIDESWLDYCVLIWKRADGQYGTKSLCGGAFFDTNDPKNHKLVDNIDGIPKILSCLHGTRALFARQDAGDSFFWISFSAWGLYVPLVL